MNGPNADPEVRVARHSRGGYYMLGLSGLLAAVWCLITYQSISADNNWVKSEGQYVEASVTEGKYKDLQITYKFNVGGKTYTATEIEKSPNQQHLVEKVKARYEKNPTIPIYYKPSDPAQSRLGFVSPTAELNVYLVVGILSVIIVLISIFALLKSPRD